MLSLVIKNAILIILIILIVHFLLKGMLDERKTPLLILDHDTKALPKHTPSGSVGSLGSSAPKTTLSSEPMPISKLVEGLTGTHSSKDDLFSYVYGGKDVSASDEAPFFPNPDPKLGMADPPEKEKGLEKGLEKEAPAPKDAGTSHHMVIREYTDEKALNGGNLFNGLSAFDAEFAPYASL